MLGLPPRLVYLTVVAVIAVLATLAVSSGSVGAQPVPANPPPYPGGPASEVLGEGMEREGEAAQPIVVALPSTGTGGFQSTGGVLMPALLLAIAGGALLAVGALAGLATTRRRN